MPPHFVWSGDGTESQQGRIKQRWSPRGHNLKSLAFASKVRSLASQPQVLENCTVLGSRTALFFESWKFCRKTPDTSRKICENLFCFPLLEIARKKFLKTFFGGDRLKNCFEDLFFLKNACTCVLGLWPRAFLSLASRESVLGKLFLSLKLVLISK